MRSRNDTRDADISRPEQSRPARLPVSSAVSGIRVRLALPRPYKADCNQYLL